jgi:hypothetical protein
MSSSNPTLQLNSIEQKTLSMTSVSANIVHDLETQQIIKVLPLSAVSGKNDIRFSLDETYLSDNNYLNKTKMRGKLSITFTGGVENPVYEAVTGLYNIIPNTASLPYLWRGETGSVSPFILNKGFSRVQLDFSGRSIDLQNRTPENITMLSEMFSKDRLENNGIYQIDLDGKYSATVGGAVNIPILDNEGTAKDNSLYVLGSDLDYLRKQQFWKQNTSGRYCRVLSNEYFNNTTGASVGGYAPVSSFEQLTTNPSPLQIPTNFNVALFAVDGTAGILENVLGLTLSTAGITACGPVAKQVIVVEIEEDLICDIFGTSYMDGYKPYAMSSKELNFTFSQSSRINELFNWAHPTPMASTSTVSIAFTSMELEFTTFKMGQDIVPTRGRTYEIPYFKENRDFQNRPLNCASATTVNLNVIQYTENPIYIRIATTLPYTEENVKAFSKNNQFIPYSKMVISVDNEVGLGLYDMSQTDVMVRTCENLGGSKSVYDRMIKTHPLPSQVNNFWSSSAGVIVESVAQYTHGNLQQTEKAFTSFVLLRVGQDIRLPKDRHSGVKGRTNYRFNLTFPSLNSLGIAGTGTKNCDVEISAYVPAKYVISSLTGLITNQELSITNDEFVSLVKSMYDQVGTDPSMSQTSQTFNIESGILLGSGWFSNLMSQASQFGKTLVARIPKFLGHAKDISGFVAQTAKQFGQQEIGDVATQVQEALQRAGYGKKGGMGGDMMASGNFDMMASGKKKKTSKYA